MLKRIRITVLPFACIAALAVLTTTLRADELAEKGRAIYKKHQLSVVTVQLVLKSKFNFPGVGGQSNESRQDATGTVVDPSGLIVLSLSATDPSQLLQAMMAGADEDSKIKMDTELTDAKILLDDGTEVPAEVVLRDKDLDLAFVRPKAKLATPMTALDLSKSGKAEVLDQVVTLNRLGKAAGRSYSASIERISAIVQRPRLFYVPDTTMSTTSVGSPAFTLDGNPLGIFLMRSVRGRSGGGLSMVGFQPENIAGIILPADDILKAAKQVPAAEEKQSEKK